MNPYALRMLADDYEEHDDELNFDLLRKYADAWQLLIDAVNETDQPCPPECDSIAHAEGCPHIDRAAWMVKQQATIVDLRQRLEAAEKWAQAEWHRGNMLAGWAAGNVSNAGCDEASREAGTARDRYAALAAGVCSECGTGGWKHTRDCTVPFGEG